MRAGLNCKPDWGMAMVHPKGTYRIQLLLFAAALTFATPAGSAEGASVSLPLARSAWIWSSVPVGQDASLLSHARLEWYNARHVRERDLRPDLHSYEGGDNERQVLELKVKPPVGEATLGSEDWTGVALPLSGVGPDLTKVQYIEIWINDFTPDHSTTPGTLKVDLGRVSEDSFWDPNNLPNGRLDTEDKNRDGRLDGVSQLFGEDTGLDGLFDEEEPGYDPSTNPDPNGDDYAYTFDSGDYSRINNFEQNGGDDPSARPDTEDLNRNGIADLDNAYFEATIDLSDTQYVAVDVPQAYAGNPDVKPDNGWRLFRIPASESAFTAIGFASWDNVRAVRLWIDGLSEPFRVQIGGVSLRGEALPGVAPKVVLYQNYPNPFNPTTTIPYYLPQDGPARLVVYDVSGRLVYRVTYAMQSAGTHEFVWTGRDYAGRPVTSGIYFYRLDAGGKQLTRRMVLAK